MNTAGTRLLIVALAASCCLPAAHSAPTCGLDNVRSASQHRPAAKQRTRRAGTSLTPTVDARFHYPSQSEPEDTVLPGVCTVKDDLIGIFGVGYSECYSPEATRQYGSLESWPSTDLKVTFKTFTDGVFACALCLPA